MLTPKLPSETIKEDPMHLKFWCQDAYLKAIVTNPASETARHHSFHFSSHCTKAAKHAEWSLWSLARAINDQISAELGSPLSLSLECP